MGKTEIEGGCLKQGRPNVWKFVIHKDYTITIDFLKDRECDFKWLSIGKDGKITVKGSVDKGYAWDGCTPKINFLQITWGTFDGKLKRFDKGDYKPYTYYASMVHDVLYQYKRCVPVTRKEADKIFLKMLRKAGYMWAGLYYIAVRMFGWEFTRWKYRSKKQIK